MGTRIESRGILKKGSRDSWLFLVQQHFAQWAGGGWNNSPRASTTSASECNKSHVPILASARSPFCYEGVTAWVISDLSVMGLEKFQHHRARFSCSILKDCTCCIKTPSFISEMCPRSAFCPFSSPVLELRFQRVWNRAIGIVFLMPP